MPLAIKAFVFATVILFSSIIRAAPITLDFVSTGTQPASGTLILPDDSLLRTGEQNVNKCQARRPCTKATNSDSVNPAARRASKFNGPRSLGA